MSQIFLRVFSRFFLFASVLTLFNTNLFALPFAQGRASGGYANLQGDQGSKAVSTAIVSGTGRFGYIFDNSNYFVALDVSAYRIYEASSLGTNNDGNSGLFVFGHNWEYFALWIAGGAGEIRGRDRASEKTRPYRYYATDAQLGLTTDLYRSPEARVEIGATIGRISPDPEWRARYGLKAINTLQIDIGFKLLNW